MDEILPIESEGSNVHTWSPGSCGMITPRDRIVPTLLYVIYVQSSSRSKLSLVRNKKRAQ